MVIERPEHHLVDIRLEIDIHEIDPSQDLELILPAWSPGSYLIREYCKHIQGLRVLDNKGRWVNFEQVEKAKWVIPNQALQSLESLDIRYKVYCHDVSVRTSFVNQEHAFLHGPTLFITPKSLMKSKIALEVRFPGLWSKLHTGLKDVSPKRDEFHYEASDYDELVDCPIEIGCHESDGFRVHGKDHHMIHFGQCPISQNQLKSDFKVIVETVAKHFDNDLPYDQYLFITHFLKGKFGGLEHRNSTALHFDPLKLLERKSYVQFLSLVAHEYFHTWNVKRIRPLELGPFNYEVENYTKMHWLTEGLTSFMDELMVFRSGLCSLAEYLEMQKDNLARYYSIEGRRFHSLEESSFNAWVKLYRPDEFSDLSTISYYLKGGLVFMALHFELVERGSSIDELLKLLWKSYKERPEQGLTKEEVLEMILTLSDHKLVETFDRWISTTDEIDFQTYFKNHGMDLVYESQMRSDLGLQIDPKTAVIQKIKLDGPAYRQGLNVGDEIIAIDGFRVFAHEVDQVISKLSPGKSYTFTISRLEVMKEIHLHVERMENKLSAIQVLDPVKAKKTLSFPA